MLLVAKMTLTVTDERKRKVERFARMFASTFDSPKAFTQHFSSLFTRTSFTFSPFALATLRR